MWKLKTSKDDLGRCVWYFDPNESEALSEEQSRFFDSFDKKINRTYRNQKIHWREKNLPSHK
ncbi:hypothetical protein MHBO_000333 [Bonamia ostreae]|uniref:Uncharacterized protein n=1 Tax=Bonamia ostreae TaxID=126728 RepID=A0ABV2AFA9_9EUKA